jgi:hypothetical protein
MARTAKQRLTELINEEDSGLRKLLWEILRIEQAHRVNQEKGAEDKVSRAIFKAASKAN